MGIQSIKATINSQEIVLVYNPDSEYWEAQATAPSQTSWGEQDHKYGISLEAKDQAGNRKTIDRLDETFGSSLQLRVFEKDAPKIVIKSPSSDAFITNAKPTITWVVTDEGSGVNKASITLKIDEQPAITEGILAETAEGGFNCQYTPSEPLYEGAHILRFNASDNDGNRASETVVSFTVDTIPPTLDLEHPKDNLITNSTSIQVSGTTEDETSSPVTVTVKVGDGEPVQMGVFGGTFNTTVQGTIGQNTITVTATDAAGKTTSITRTVTIDTTAPVFVEVKVEPNPVDAGATYLIKVKATDE